MEQFSQLRSNSHLFFKQIKGQILGDSPGLMRLSIVKRKE